MKHIFTIMLISIFLSGCNTAYRYQDKVFFTEYQDDPEDVYKLPEQLIEDGGGDCEDYAFLACKILLAAGEECVLEVGEVRGEESGGALHAVAISGNTVYSNKQVGTLYKYRSQYEAVYVVSLQYGSVCLRRCEQMKRIEKFFKEEVMKYE